MKKVSAGDPLAIPAETFNTFIDMARDYRARLVSQTIAGCRGRGVCDHEQKRRYRSLHARG